MARKGYTPNAVKKKTYLKPIFQLYKLNKLNKTNYRLYIKYYIFELIRIFFV